MAVKRINNLVITQYPKKGVPFLNSNQLEWVMNLGTHGIIYLWLPPIVAFCSP